MRISDWSSDVCSSDLSNRHPSKLSQKRAPAGRAKAWCQVLHERFRSRAAESWTVPADQPKSVQLVLLSCLVRMRAKRLILKWCPWPDSNRHADRKSTRLNSSH